jgi:multidrug efflux pump subunit AcrA (membrane-fusion protein)
LSLGADDDEDEEEAGLEAELDEDLDEVGDTEETARTAGSASLRYVVNNPAEGKALVPGQVVFVTLTLQGSGTELKIVPFAAVLYGVNGETWVYTNPEPLVFVRAPVAVNHIKAGSAFLSDGPSVGTQVVTMGGSLLYGAETGVSK